MMSASGGSAIRSRSDRVALGCSETALRIQSREMSILKYGTVFFSIKEYFKKRRGKKQQPPAKMEVSA